MASPLLSPASSDPGTPAAPSPHRRPRRFGAHDLPRRVHALAAMVDAGRLSATDLTALGQRNLSNTVPDWPAATPATPWCRPSRNLSRVFKLINFLKLHAAPTLGLAVSTHPTISAALTNHYLQHAPTATHGSQNRGLAIASFLSPLINRLGLERIMNDPALVQLLPPADPPIKPPWPVICYKYEPTLGRKWFNFQQVARLPVAEQDTTCAASCICDRYPALIPPGHSHIHTTDISTLVTSANVIKLWGLGTKYRPCQLQGSEMHECLRTELHSTFKHALASFASNIEEHLARPLALRSHGGGGGRH
jgi:hypothetical protein